MQNMTYPDVVQRLQLRRPITVPSIDRVCIFQFQSPLEVYDDNNITALFCRRRITHEYIASCLLTSVVGLLAIISRYLRQDVTRE